MNITLNDTDKYEVYKNGNLILKSGDYIEAAIAMLTYDSQQYDLRLFEADKGLKWERHEGVAMKGFPGKFTLGAVAGQ